MLVVFSLGVNISGDFYSFFVLIYSFQIFHSEPILLFLKKKKVKQVLLVVVWVGFYFLCCLGFGPYRSWSECWYFSQESPGPGRL